MFSKKNKTVTESVWLVDPLTGGHHDSYLVEYALLLEEIGFKVQILSPKPARAKKIFAELSKNDVSRVNFHSFDVQKPFILKNSDKSWIKSIGTFLLWWRVYIQIIKSRGLENLKREFVLFMWLESFIDTKIYAWFLKYVFICSWAGIYFHPSFLRLRKDRIFEPIELTNLQKIDTYSFIATLDKSISGELEKILKKKVYWFPEITYIQTRDTKFTKSVFQAIKQKHIVCIPGSLEKRKGIMNLMRVANSKKMQNVFFLFVGKLYEATFTKSDLDLINYTVKKCDNVALINRRIEDEAEFNNFIFKSNIVALPYSNFYHSSNLLIKAAYLKKPVIVGSGYYMAELVKKYNLGYVVNESSTEDIKETIVKIVTNGEFKKNKTERQYEKFYESNSKDKLSKILNHAINGV